MGQVVATLVEGDLAAQTYAFNWDAGDMPSGMYLAKAQGMNMNTSQKLLLLK
jgi:hypothetical protein